MATDDQGAMTSELDIYRTANLLIEKHGEGAYMQAVKRRDEMQRKGDAEGRHVWRRVITAVIRLQSDAAKGPAH